MKQYIISFLRIHPCTVYKNEKNQTARDYSHYVKISRHGRTKRNDDRREELSICRRIESRIVYVERVGRIFDLPNRDGSEFQLTWLLIEQEKDKAKFKTISEKF